MPYHKFRVNFLTDAGAFIGEPEVVWTMTPRGRYSLDMASPGKKVGGLRFYRGAEIESSLLESTMMMPKEWRA